MISTALATLLIGAVAWSATADNGAPDLRAGLIPGANANEALTRDAAAAGISPEELQWQIAVTELLTTEQAQSDSHYAYSEFTGGRSVTVAFSAPINGELRDALNSVGGSVTIIEDASHSERQLEAVVREVVAWTKHALPVGGTAIAHSSSPRAIDVFFYSPRQETSKAKLVRKFEASDLKQEFTRGLSVRFHRSDQLPTTVSEPRFIE